MEEGSDSRGMYPRGDAEGLTACAAAAPAAGATAPVTTAVPCGRLVGPVVTAGILSIRGCPVEPEGEREHPLVGTGVEHWVPEEVVTVVG